MKHRIEFIDLIKGFAILTVVIGHFIENNYSNGCKSIMSFNFIYTFHMPLFVFIGGYVAQFQYRIASLRNWGGYFIKKSRELMIPFLLGYLILQMFFTGNVMLVNLMPQTLFAQAMSNLVAYNGLWYLIVFWALSIIGYITISVGNVINKKMSSKIIIEGLVLGTIIGIIYILNKLYPYELWRQIIAYFIFFFIGVYMSRYELLQKIADSKITYTIGWIALFIAASQFTGENVVYRIIGGLASIPVFYYLSRHIGLNKYVNSFLLTIGRYSLAIYIVHWYFLKILSQQSFLDNLSQWWITFISIIASIIISFVCVQFAKLIETIPMVNFLLFGKKLSLNVSSLKREH